MKKIFVLAVVAGAFAMTSCKKERDCVCTVGGETLTAKMGKASKSDQEDACNALQATYSLTGATASCSLD